MSTTARAAVLREVGRPAEIEEVTFGDPAPGEVLVRTSAAGVCHSDLHFVEGHYGTDLPVVLGHESAGVVEAIGDGVTHVVPGDHVITCMTAFCGNCRECVRGRPQLCESPGADRPEGAPPRVVGSGGEAIGQLYSLGSYAEAMLVSERTVVKIRDEMPLDRGALIGCAVITGFGAVTNTARVPLGSTVAVVGCGGIGLSSILGAVASGASMIIAIDVRADKLETARAFGATHVIDASAVDPVEAVVELTDGGVEFSFEAIGRVATAEQAFRMLRPGGEATVIGMVPEDADMAIRASELLFEKTLRGSNMGSNRFRVDMPMLVERYLAGSLPLDEMISRRVALDDLNDAFAAMSSGEVARSVIIF